MALSASQKKKRDFRASKKWKDLRHKKNVEQNGKDPITGKRLLTGANLHHLDLDEKHYTDLSNEDNFVLLNKMTHKVLHFLFTYYKNDRDVLERFKDYLDRMVALNEK